MFKYPDFKFEIILSLIKFFLFFYLVYYNGFIIGFILFYSSVFIYHRFLELYLNANMLIQTDKIFLGDKPIERINLVGISDLVDFDKDKIKEKLKEAVIKVPKLNSKLVYFLGNYFWQQPKLNEDKSLRYKNISKDNKSNNNNIKFEERFNNVLVKEVRSLRNYHEALDYAHKQINIPLELDVNSFECHLINYTDSNERRNGAVVFKMDHALSDGMGVLSLLLCLADNFNLDLFPAKLKKFPNFFKRMIITFVSFFQFILFGWKILYRLIINKSNNKLFTNDNRTGIANISKKTEEFDLNSIKKISKHFNITLNDAIITIISATLKKISPDSKDISLVLPVGNTAMPKNLNEVNNILKNSASGVNTLISLVDLNINSRNNSNNLDLLEKQSNINLLSEKILNEDINKENKNKVKETANEKCSIEDLRKEIKHQIEDEHLELKKCNTRLIYIDNSNNKNKLNNNNNLKDKSNNNSKKANKIKKGFNLIHSQLKALLANKFIADSSVNIINTIAAMLPLKITKYIGLELSKNMDILVSNIPGPAEELYYNGCKVRRLIPFTSTGPNKGFIMIFSYFKTLYLTPNFDVGQNINPNEFNKIFKNIVEKLIKYID